MSKMCTKRALSADHARCNEVGSRCQGGHLRTTHRLAACPFVPKYLAQCTDTKAEKTWRVSNQSEALYTLIDIEPGALDHPYVRELRYQGGSVTTLAVPYKGQGVTGYYLHVDTLLRPLSGFARSVMARAQHTEQLFDYNVRTQEECFVAMANPSGVTVNINQPVCLTQLSVLAGRTNLERFPVSQYHMRNYSMNLLRDFIKRNKGLLPRLSLLNTLMASSVPEVGEATYITMAVYILTLKQDDFVLVSQLDVWWKCTTVKEWAVRAKELSVHVKSIQNMGPLDLRIMFELDVLVNRGYGAVDWAAERVNRTTGLKVTDHTAEEIYTLSRKLFLEGLKCGRKPTKARWHQFIQNRWEWATPGSVHSQYSVDREYIPSEHKCRTKWHTLSQMPMTNIDYWINRQPEMIAWPSTKYEWGKMRAIYGVDLTNYVMSSYGFAGAEDVLPPRCPLGAGADKKNLQSTVRDTLQAGVPYCLDFDDFNSQHSVASMVSCLTAYRDVMAVLLDCDQVRAINWVIKALRRIRVVIETGDHGTIKAAYRAMGTLLSGWRLTTLVNTVLNYCYVRTAIPESVCAALHSGDDVLINVKTLRQVRAIETALEHRGCRKQRTKCFLGSISEFLRVDHREEVGSGQYLARAVSTFTHSPMETKDPVSLCSVLSSLRTRALEVIERKADNHIVSTMFAQQLAKTSRIWDVPYSLIRTVITTPKSLGGLSELWDRHNPRRTVVQHVERVTETAAATKVAPGAVDYARTICATLVLAEYIGDVARQADRALQLAKGDMRIVPRIGQLPPYVEYPELVHQYYGILRANESYNKVKLITGLGLPLISLREQTTHAVRTITQYPQEERMFWVSVLT